MFQPTVRWEEQGDSEFLMWGHIKVGEVTLGSGGWYGYYRADNSDRSFRSLRDFLAIDLAKAAVEDAVAKAAKGHCR